MPAQQSPMWAIPGGGINLKFTSGLITVGTKNFAVNAKTVTILVKRLPGGDEATIGKFAD